MFVPACRSVPMLLIVLAMAAVGLTACGSDSSKEGGPAIGSKGSDKAAARSLGFPVFATKNTTRIGGGDPIADAAGAAQAVFPSASPADRPAAVTLVDAKQWQAGIAAAALMARPLRAPLLLTEGSKLPDASRDALRSLAPVGSKAAAGAQVIRVATSAPTQGDKATDIKGKDPYELAAGVDRLATSVAGKSSDRVLIVSGEQAPYAMPAAGWAAKSGDAVLFVKRASVPSATLAALRKHQQPNIYVLGPSSVISAKVVNRLKSLGIVRRIAAPDATGTAIAFARYIDGSFGWGVRDPGHGLVFANPARPADAVAAAPLSASGTYGPLLLTDSRGSIEPALVQYLLDIQPGYEKDPVRGVYNHGWLMGDDGAISVADQARIDTLLEIIQVSSAGTTPRP